jgi:membrane-associated phospholipid phosphatase
MVRESACLQPGERASGSTTPRRRFGAAILASIAPSDVATLAILAVVFGTLTLRLPAVPDLEDQWVFHGALLAVFSVFVGVAARLGEKGFVPSLRALMTVGVLCTLYVSLGQVAFKAIPWLADAWLERADRTLFLGVSPALWAEGHVTYGRLEFFSFVYAIFIPYLYFSILLGCVGRPPAERNVFMTGMAITYAIGFLGYLFLPARGPVVHLSSEFASPLEGGFFHGLILSSIQGLGGPHGAFPSLHLGTSTFVCIFDLKYNRLRGLAYLPIVILIAVATVVVRYHYVVDIVAGVLLAAFSSWAALRWQAAWSARLPPSPAEVRSRRNPARMAFFLLRELELVIIGLPLAAWGVVNHAIPYLVMRRLDRSSTGAREERAWSVHHPGWVVFPILGSIQIGAAWVFLPTLWAVVYTFLLPYSGYFAALYGRRLANNEEESGEKPGSAPQ